MGCDNQCEQLNSELVEFLGNIANAF